MKRLLLVSSITVLVLGACAPPQPGPNTPDAEPTTQVETATEPDATSIPEDVATEEPAAPTPAPFDTDGPIEAAFTTEDDVTLDATVYGPPDSQTVAILAPQYPGEQEGWVPFAQAAADAGIRTVTFDLRGYGASEGERNDLDAPTDLSAAVAFAREQLGAQSIVLIGAVQSGTAAAKVAAENADVDGLVVLSAPQTTAANGLDVTESELQAISVPSLWIAARQDLLQDVETLYEAAGSADKEIWIYETSAVPGTELFNGLDAIDLEQRLLTFINQF